MITTTPEENKKIVQDGLQRRKAARIAARDDERLDAYERDMIRQCNANCYVSRRLKEVEESDRITREAYKAKKAAQAQAVAAERQRKKDAALACMIWLFFTIALVWLSTWTYLPAGMAALYAICGGLFLVCYLWKEGLTTWQEVTSK